MKEIIRQEILQKRKNLSRRDKTKFDQQINTGLEDLLRLINPKKILAFFPIEKQNEVDVIPFLELLLEEGLELYLPKIIDNQLKAFLVTNLKDLEQNSAGIFEPANSADEYSGGFDLILVPGVAFDTNCNRIGYGKGFYDKFLTADIGLKVGVAYDFQVLDLIETEEHDKQLDMVLTEKMFLKK